VVSVYYLMLSLVLIFAPDDGVKPTIQNYVARNCPSASALIECLFLSLQISYALTYIRSGKEYDRGDRHYDEQAAEFL